MYIRYQIGNPSIKTESVVQKLEVTDGKLGNTRQRLLRKTLEQQIFFIL